MFNKGMSRALDALRTKFIALYPLDDDPSPYGTQYVYILGDKKKQIQLIVFHF